MLIVKISDRHFSTSSSYTSALTGRRPRWGSPKPPALRFGEVAHVAKAIPAETRHPFVRIVLQVSVFHISPSAWGSQRLPFLRTSRVFKDLVPAIPDQVGPRFNNPARSRRGASRRGGSRSRSGRRFRCRRCGRTETK